MNKIVVYDLETIKNLFTACFYDIDSKTKKQFYFYDDIEEFKKFMKFLKALHKNNYTLLGFNVLNFDSQILEYIIANADEWLENNTIEEIVEFVYERSQQLINLEGNEKFEIMVPEYKLTIPHIDVYKQKHYDRPQKATSLKWLQFTMRYPNIEEMPIEHDQLVAKEDIPKVFKYNWNDVDSTNEFFNRIKFETELRETLSQKFGMNLLNASEPRIAKMIFAKFLCENMGIKYNELKEMRTFRKQVNLGQTIFKYVKFETPELKRIHEIVKTAVVLPHAADFELNFNYGGIDTVVGLGGIHACCNPGVYESREDLIMHDIDVISYYPNLAIENDIKPRHLGNAFNKTYKMIFDDRQKIPKSDPMNYVYKIILNAAYGLSKEINSYLYDPFFTYSITINGQLSILMLVEQLVLRIPNLKIYQENTDGVTIGYNPEHKQLVTDICNEWCRVTKLALEHAFYKKMVIRDVNNYMAIKEGFDWDDYEKWVAEGKKRADYGKIKHKGTFEIEMDYHKNPSFLVINKAVEAFFFGGKDFREFIDNHDDIFDMCAGVKKKKDFDLNINVIEGTEHVQLKQQKVTRFYISHSGGVMTKDFHSGKKANARSSVIAKWRVKPVNVIEDTSASKYEDLNRTYYIKEAEKLIYSVKNDVGQTKLF